MATSAISISSNAFILLGSTAIASFNDSSSEATIASALYENSYTALLTNHRWRFATKKVKMARLAKTPLNDYSNAFQIPSDCLYVITPTTSNYEIFETEIQANALELDLEYIYRVAEDKLPAYFSKALEFYLASQFAIPLTGSLDKADYYSKVHLDQLRKAKFADSTQRPVDAVTDDPYLDIRY